MLQIVYRSTLTPQCTRDDVQRIRQKSEQNNPRLGLTGLLLIYGRNVVSLVEGEDVIVLDMLERVASDKRHRDLTVMREAAVQGPRFTSWTFSWMEDYPPSCARKDAERFAIGLARRLGSDGQFAANAEASTGSLRRAQ